MYRSAVIHMSIYPCISYEMLSAFVWVWRQARSINFDIADFCVLINSAPIQFWPLSGTPNSKQLRITLYRENFQARWRHATEVLSTLLALCEGNPPDIDNFFVRSNKLLNKLSSYRWFKTPWRSCDVTGAVRYKRCFHRSKYDEWKREHSLSFYSHLSQYVKVIRIITFWRNNYVFITLSVCTAVTEKNIDLNWE